MKTLKINLAALLFAIFLTGTAASTSAQGTVRINPYLNTDLSIVSIINPSNASLRMKIYDEEGTLYYSQKIQEKTTDQKLFDFSYLEDGTYKIVLNGDSIDLEKEFDVVNKKLALKETNETNEKTFFRADNNNVFVTYLSFDQENFQISITDQEGEEVFLKSYNSTPRFTQKFDVKELPQGEYNVRLISNSKEYNYAFRK